MPEVVACNYPDLCLLKREKYMHQSILYPGSLKFETYLEIPKPQCYFSHAYSMSVASKFACVVFTCHEFFFFKSYPKFYGKVLTPDIILLNLYLKSHIVETHVNCRHCCINLSLPVYYYNCDISVRYFTVREKEILGFNES